MGKGWCADLPHVTVPLGDVPKTVTFVYPYYENPAFLQRQYDGWQAYPAELRARLRVIVVDDGSPTAPAATVPPCAGVALRRFRIGVDVRWNWLAARNIGATHADEGWLLLTDMDHVVPIDTLRALVYGRHDPAQVYAFRRLDTRLGEVGPHSASFFLTKARFWQTGGYDEALSGHYGTDGEFRRRLGPVVLSSDVLIRHEYEGDSSTTTYLRKQPQDAAVSRLVKARRPGWRPRTLSFPYVEVPA